MSIIAKENTDNQKIGNSSTTYSGLNTCPSDCPFRKGACYAMHGPLGIIFRRLSKTKNSHLREAQAEDEGIRNLSGEKDLRIHTTGDCKSDAAAQIVSNAAKEYCQRFGRKAWTFTHAWRQVKRSSWGQVSVLASCENPSQIKEAQKWGYATALVVKSFSSSKVFKIDGVSVIPCPNQVAKHDGRKVTCTQCRLCLDDTNLLKQRLTIGFEAHGPSRKAKSMLANLEKCHESDKVNKTHSRKQS